MKLGNVKIFVQPVKNKPNGPKYTLFGPVEVSNSLNRELHVLYNVEQHFSVM